MRAKKSLGQNFLHSKTALRAMVSAGDPKGDDIILEIGPGKGALTKHLLPFVAKVITIEKDGRLPETLKETFLQEIEQGKLEIIEGDVLAFNPDALAFYDLPYKIIANIPYYITGAIIRKFLSAKRQPSLMVLMVQKEVGRRIVARDKKESILSLSVKAYGTPRYIMTVKKESFRPEPKVDSAILLIEDISKDFFVDFSEEEFFTLVKQAFRSKRKTLRNNLKSVFGKDTESILRLSGIDPNRRAEDITLHEWRTLSARTRTEHDAK